MKKGMKYTTVAVRESFPPLSKIQTFSDTTSRSYLSSGFFRIFMK